MPPTNILLGMSVPYFGTDGGKLTGVSGRDMSIDNCTTESNVKHVAIIHIIQDLYKTTLQAHSLS